MIAILNVNSALFLVKRLPFSCEYVSSSAKHNPYIKGGIRKRYYYCCFCIKLLNREYICALMSHQVSNNMVV